MTTRHPTRYWHPLDDGRIQCDLCPRCKLHEGQRVLLRAGVRGRRDRADDLRAVERVLRRPDREEAAEPLPARHAGPLVRHGRLQPRLQVLPELGHLEVARDRHAGRRRVARRHRARGGGARLPERRVHVQRPGDLRGVRDRRRRRLPRARHQDGRRHRRLHLPRAARGVLRHMDAANVDLKGFTEDFYHDVCLRAARAACSRRSRT